MITYVYFFMELITNLYFWILQLKFIYQPEVYGIEGLAVSQSNNSLYTHSILKITHFKAKLDKKQEQSTFEN